MFLTTVQHSSRTTQNKKTVKSYSTVWTASQENCVSENTIKEDTILCHATELLIEVCIVTLRHAKNEHWLYNIAESQFPVIFRWLLLRTNSSFRMRTSTHLKRKLRGSSVYQWGGGQLWWWFIRCDTPYSIVLYRGADNSLARLGWKQATATEDFDVHISYL